jgi:hypothetical protein
LGIGGRIIRVDKNGKGRGLGHEVA